jgi:hypothetical protein
VMQAIAERIYEQVLRAITDNPAREAA